MTLPTRAILLVLPQPDSRLAARVTKSVDVADSKSAAARRASSSLASGTKLLMVVAGG